MTNQSTQRKQMKFSSNLKFSVVVASCFAAWLVPARAEADDGEQIPEWLIEYCEEMANWPPELPPTNYERCKCDYYLQRIPRSIVRQLCDYWDEIHPGTYGDPSEIEMGR